MEPVRFPLFLSNIAASRVPPLRVKSQALSKKTALLFKRKWVQLAWLLAIFVPAAHAQSSVTAASCSQSDVNAVINGPTHTAVDGDTIHIPAGSCTWSSGITISGVGISVRGAGAPHTGTGTSGAGTSTTTITDSINDGATPLFNVQGVSRGRTIRFSMMQIQPGGVTNGYSPFQIIGSCTAGGCPNLRMDNITFTGWAGSGPAAAWLVRVDNMYGVLDHNSVATVLLANVNHSAWLGVGHYGDNSWAQPDSFGTASALYFENNLFTDNGGPFDTDASDLYQDVGGARVVVRYNTYTGLASSASYFHGTETTGRPRGGRQLEMYNNSIAVTGSAFGVLSTMRSGVGYIYNNATTTTGSGVINYWVAAMVLRTYRGPSPGWGSCDGTGASDTNDGRVYASGTITSVSGSTQFSDSTKNWATNQWTSNGAPYSVHNITQNFGDEIASNTSSTITLTSPPLNNTDSPFAWNAGDRYEILRAAACVDQPGRTAGNPVSGATPTPAGSLRQPIGGIYEWGNTLSGSKYNLGITSNGTSKLIADRDFYAYNGSFSGTSGTGSGLLASIPATCTAGVAYWVTDENALYKCTATNVWASVYTPYTYPHPLTTGSVASLPAAPTGLTATVQ
jgi:hypothetical protein